MLERGMLLGTAERSQGELAEALQRIGGSLRVERRRGPAAARRRVAASRAPASCSACWPRCSPARATRARPVEGEAGRLADQLRRACRSRAWWPTRRGCAGCTAATPTAASTRTPDEVLAVPPASLRAAHRRRVVPDGSLLVLVGDLTPARALDQVAAAMSGWDSSRRPEPGAGGAAGTAGAAAAGRPAGCRAVQPAGGRAGTGAHRPVVRRRRGGQRAVRRLLLLPAGHEHPRGQGLHLQPAQRAAARRRGLRAW